MKFTAPIAALAAIVACGIPAVAQDCGAAAQPTAMEVLARCRDMLPRAPVRLSGSIVVRNRKGIPSAEYDYTLDMDRTAAPAKLDIEVRERNSTNVADRTSLLRPGPVPQGTILKTDVKWTDLALDFLWWPKAEYDGALEGESVHGQVCTVIVARNGDERMRLWTDRKTGCLMQAEELDEAGKAKRRIWGTRLKKFDGRWMASVLEVETLGGGRRTKITVETLKEKQPPQTGRTMEKQ